MIRAITVLVVAVLAVIGSVATAGLVIQAEDWSAFAPSTHWYDATMVEGRQDQHCSATNRTWADVNNPNPDWRGPQNQIAWTCLSTPVITPGLPDNLQCMWAAVLDLRGFTGHTSQIYFSGNSLLNEGQLSVITNPDGSKKCGLPEKINRIALWDYERNGGLFHHDAINPNTFVFGQTDKPIDTYTTGSAFARSFLASPKYYGVEVVNGVERWHQGVTSTAQCRGAGTMWVGGVCVYSAY